MQQLAHGRPDDRHLVFTPFQLVVTKRLDNRVVASRDNRRKMHRLPQLVGAEIAEAGFAMDGRT